MGYDLKTLDPKLQRQIAEKQGLVAPEGTKVYTFMNSTAYCDERNAATKAFMEIAPASVPDGFVQYPSEIRTAGEGYQFNAPEKYLQRDCETWLTFMGYWPRDDKHLFAAPSPSGWFVHLVDAQRNSILLDFLILREDGHFIEIEIKRKGGKISKRQKAIIDHCGGREAWAYEEFKKVVTDWEERINRAH